MGRNCTVRIWEGRELYGMKGMMGTACPVCIFHWRKCLKFRYRVYRVPKKNLMCRNVHFTDAFQAWWRIRTGGSCAHSFLFRTVCTTVLTDYWTFYIANDYVTCKSMQVVRGESMGNKMGEKPCLLRTSPLWCSAMEWLQGTGSQIYYLNKTTKREGMVVRGCSENAPSVQMDLQWGKVNILRLLLVPVSSSPCANFVNGKK